MKRVITFLILILLISPVILAENETTQAKEKLSALKGGIDEQKVYRSAQSQGTPRAC